MKIIELNNIIEKELSNRGLSYTKVPFCKSFIRELYNQYKLIEVAKYHYCCYGPYLNCWIEVEGIDYGWLFLDYTEEEMPKVLLRKIFNWIKYARFPFGRHIFKVETKNAVYIILPGRDLRRAKADYILSFGKNNEAEGIN